MITTNIAVTITQSVPQKRGQPKCSEQYITLTMATPFEVDPSNMLEDYIRPALNKVVNIVTHVNRGSMSVVIKGGER